MLSGGHAAVVHPRGVFGRALGLAPFVEHVPLHVVEFLHHLGRAAVGGQLQAMAARVKEINALEDGVIDGTEHIDAACDQFVFGCLQCFERFDLERQVLHPGGGVLVAVHGRLAGQLKEGQDVAVARIQKDVHVRVGRFGGGHFVFGNGQHEFHVQVLLVPLDGFFGVFAAVGDMMNFLNEHDISPNGYSALC